MFIKSDKKCLSGCRYMEEVGVMVHKPGCPRNEEINRWYRVYYILKELDEVLGYTKAEIDEHYLWVRNRYESKMKGEGHEG